MKKDLSSFVCRNQSCVDFGKAGRENLIVDSWYGSKRQCRMLLCRSCRSRFSERKGTIYFHSQISSQTIERMRKLLGDGQSIRKTALEVGVNRNTVIRYARLFALSNDHSNA